MHVVLHPSYQTLLNQSQPSTHGAHSQQVRAVGPFLGGQRARSFRQQVRREPPVTPNAWATGSGAAVAVLEMDVAAKSRIQRLVLEW